MGTKRNDFDESTKVRSAAEIDEMLRSATAEAHEDFEHDAHTKVGNIDELVAQTRARTADPIPVTPRPPASGAARNVVRRASSPVIAATVGRNTPGLGVTRAAGSQSEIEPAAKSKSDDAAFDEMVDEPVEHTSERTFGEKAMPLALPAPPISGQLPAVAKLPEAPRTQNVRWGIVAWFALLAIMIGVGSVGYIRIKQLEDQLAAAKTKLERK